MITFFLTQYFYIHSLYREYLNVKVNVCGIIYLKLSIISKQTVKIKFSISIKKSRRTCSTGQRDNIYNKRQCGSAPGETKRRTQ